MVLKTSFSNLKKKLKRDYSFLDLFVVCATESAKLDILRYKLEQAHDTIAMAVEKINHSPGNNKEHVKSLTSLICLKAEILAKLGYSEDAYNLLQKVKHLYGSKSRATNKSSAPVSSIEKVGFVTCDLALARIDIENSNFALAEAKIEQSEALLENIFSTGENDFRTQALLLRLLMAKETMDFALREKYANDLEKSYKNFDHFRLMKSNEFIEFVKERILFLIDNTRFDSAYTRVNNILSVLDEKTNGYWYNQFLMLKAICLHGLREFKKGYLILKGLLPWVMDKKRKLNDWKMFVELHYNISKEDQSELINNDFPPAKFLNFFDF